ncbi:type 1 glutamine amidotransferase domain-containing protein [Corynebacterium gerontici]|uniref:Molecular chaperone Hsp31 and glyoxalase 3 n=1 Tax=Corynebacterium gerontici TaxID=2079234 RepID=A0A3G6J0E5_9CORY|nr:type 1 glutamine amidotransferase domain-containing protein [Corynebacterium gerontici]AZA10418.1 Molecular chaperone Hsp31 and glyoxalase 3 [Corynebacterium gerontici]
MTKRILHIVTNVAKYETKPERPTGLWLSELTHAWDEFEAQGYEQHIASPKGGFCPIEPQSLKFPFFDESAKAWYTNIQRMQLLGDTAAVADLDAEAYDAIYLTGGHGVMFDFPESEGLQHLIRDIADRGGVVASVCHGYCGLVNVRDTHGELLVNGRKLTGFSWMEEKVAGVSKIVPYNIEERIKERGAEYSKKPIPFVSNVVVDERLVTGQNPSSAKAVAEAVVETMG